MIRISGPSPPSFIYSVFARKTRIYPAPRTKNHCEFMNQINNREAGVFVSVFVCALAHPKNLVIIVHAYKLKDRKSVV